MKIDKIGTVSFGNTKHRALKTASNAAITLTAAINANNFVKGLSKPNDFIDAYINSSSNAVDANAAYNEGNYITTSFCDDDCVECMDCSTSPLDCIDETSDSCVTGCLDCCCDD